MEQINAEGGASICYYIRSDHLEELQDSINRKQQFLDSLKSKEKDVVSLVNQKALKENKDFNNQILTKLKKEIFKRFNK